MLGLCKRSEIPEHADDIYSSSFSHYKSITEPRARFLLSFLEDISIDFPSHFILSLIDVYRDTTTRDKLIFPSTIMQILHHFSVSFSISPHFTVICAIDAATVCQSVAQLRPRRPRIEMVTPLASTTPSTSAPSSSVGGVTPEAIMAHLVCMDTRLNTHNDELCQVNTRVSHITLRQAIMGGFTVASPPSPPASKDESDDGYINDDADEDNGASSPNDDEMST